MNVFTIEPGYPQTAVENLANDFDQVTPIDTGCEPSSGFVGDKQVRINNRIHLSQIVEHHLRLWGGCWVMVGFSVRYRRTP